MTGAGGLGHGSGKRVDAVASERRKGENEEEFVQGGNAESRVSALAIGNDAGFLDSKLVRRTFDAYASEGKGTDLALALGQADLE